MELHAVDVAAPDDRGERAAVVAAAQHVALLVGHAPRRSARGRRPRCSPRPVEQRRGAREGDLVPADVRDLQRAGLERARPGRAAARARGRRRARSTSRRAAACPGTARGPASPPPRARRRARRGPARAWRASPRRRRRRRGRRGRRRRAARRGRRSARRGRRRARAPSRRCGGCPSRGRRSRRRPRLRRPASPSEGLVVSVPFVDGTPVSVGSMATAARSARAKALKAASIMWWALVPASTSTWMRHARGVGHRAEELLGQLVVEAARAAGRQVGGEVAVAGARRCRSRTTRAPRPSAPWPRRSA